MRNQRFEIPPIDLKKAQERHKWLIDIIDLAGEASKSIPFFQEIKKAKTIKDFYWTRHLYHHSYTLTHFLAEVCRKEASDDLRWYYAGHLFEEAPHSTWLLNWMKEKGIVQNDENLKNELPTLATMNCIDYGSRLALLYNLSNWIVGINCGIEKCSQIFFSTLVPILKRLELCDYYFEVHVDADEFHSTEGLVFLPTIDPNSVEGKYLCKLVLQGISLWCGMLNSWVGVNQVPSFDENGKILI